LSTIPHCLSPNRCCWLVVTASLRNSRLALLYFILRSLREKGELGGIQNRLRRPTQWMDSFRGCKNTRMLASYINWNEMLFGSKYWCRNSPLPSSFLFACPLSVTACSGLFLSHLYFYLLTKRINLWIHCHFYVSKYTSCFLWKELPHCCYYTWQDVAFRNTIYFKLFLYIHHFINCI